MRLAPLAALGLILVTSPVWAQATGKAVFSSYTCSQPVPCGDVEGATSEQWAQAGNACIARGFGYNNPDGFIDETAGLNSSNCLTAKPGALPKGMGAQLAPQCCVIQLSANRCGIHCDIVTQ